MKRFKVDKSNVMSDSLTVVKRTFQNIAESAKSLLTGLRTQITLQGRKLLRTPLVILLMCIYTHKCIWYMPKFIYIYIYIYMNCYILNIYIFIYSRKKILSTLNNTF